MLFSYIVILTCIWWIVFFMALPFGAEVKHHPENGHADSAPTNPRIGLKIIITTVISLSLTAIIVYLLEHNYVANFIEKFFPKVYL